jgi:hypothetical protein
MIIKILLITIFTIFITCSIISLRMTSLILKQNFNDGKRSYSIHNWFAIFPVFCNTWRKNELYLVWLQPINIYLYEYDRRQPKFPIDFTINRIGIFSIKIK